MPEYLARTLTQTSLQIVFIEAIPQPRRDSIGDEDPGAMNISLDMNANFRI